MAAFDPFANQGGPAAWDPQHPNNSRELADRLLRDVDDDAVENDVKDALDREEPPIDDDPLLAPEFTD